MSERERGQEAMLHNFRIHMKEIVEQLTGKDGTIEQLHRVEDLTAQEGEFWNSYEKLIRSALADDADYALIGAEAESLGKDARIRTDQASREKKEMVCIFYNWMCNRLAPVIANMYVLVEDPSLLEEIKADLREELAKF